jgi:hypothetical protein
MGLADAGAESGARRRLLFVGRWFLFPACTGGRIRTSQLLRGLKGGAFSVTLASPATLLAGAALRPGAFLRADGPGDFAGALVRLLEDRALGARLAAEARSLVEATLSSARVAAAFERVCLAAIGATPGWGRGPGEGACPRTP